MVPHVREGATHLWACNFSSSSGKRVFQQNRPDTGIQKMPQTSQTVDRR
jgi:hypothetical protein